MVVLAAAGLAVCWVRRVRDRLGLALTAALASYAIFVAVSVAAPVEPRFQRYTDEFIDRLNYATMPVVVVLSSWAATAGWRYGWVTRGAAGTLLMAAGVYGVRAWLAWFA
jgi:hypothetical protein